MPVDIAKQIQSKIEELELLKQELPAAIFAYSKAESEYDKVLAMTIITIRNGRPVTVGEQVYCNPPVSIIERLAKGACWKAALDRDMAEGKLKSIESAIKVTMAQLNGYQSINRHLAEAA